MSYKKVFIVLDGKNYNESFIRTSDTAFVMDAPIFKDELIHDYLFYSYTLEWIHQDIDRKD